ncbi:MAG TPA: hypothetical protein VKA68_06415 [bacterium]|nr:hypothetical protein [bacterium]
MQDQYRGLQAMGQLPLWMIEGMSEYLSIGSIDNHTDMWMRDAVLHDKLPSVSDLSRRPDQYFPYRWGHAFWVYVAGTWGDSIVTDLYATSLVAGQDQAFRNILGMSGKGLVNRWTKALQATYQPEIPSRVHPSHSISDTAP